MAEDKAGRAPVKLLFLASKYTGDYPLFNSVVLGMDQGAYEVKVCYLSGTPDGKNTLDAYSKAIYLDGAGRLRGSRLRTISALVKVFRSERPDIVHCHRHKPTVLGVVAALFGGVRLVVSHVHGLDRTRTFWRRLVNGLVLKRVDRVLAVSDAVRRDVLETNPGLDSTKAETVYNGIDLEGFDASSRAGAGHRPGPSGGGPAFVTVGRLARTKGQCYLIEAFASVSEKIPGASLTIIGEGPLRDDLSGQAQSLGVSSRIEFAGYRDDVPALLGGFDVFVFPSLAEGLSLGLLEAMASRLPVVATSVGGIPEVVCGGSGYLVAAADSDALAEAMVEAASLGSEKRREMGDAGRRRVEDKFSKRVMCRRLDEVYREVLSSGAA